jgi:quinol monooxygenase YgiN
MAYVVIAKWTAKEGEEDRVWDACRKIVPETRREPGNLMYQPHRDPENPRVLLFYEQYVDAAALQAHRDSPHFQEHAVGTAIPLLESREVSFYETVDV